MSYFNKLPEGYPPEIEGRFNSFITTQFDDSMSVEMQIRSLIKWISSSRDLINDIVDYINLFIEMFDERLQEEIANRLTVWLEDGTLAEIINYELMNQKPEIHLSEEEPITNFPNTYWYHDVGLSGLQQNIFKSNVIVSDDKPEDDQYNIWLDY